MGLREKYAGALDQFVQEYGEHDDGRAAATVVDRFFGGGAR